MRSPSPVRRIRPEADRFRRALLRLRRENDWHQQTLANVLGVSTRTLSNWECGYWLPPFRQRVHVALSFRNVQPEIVLEVADALGVSTDPAVAAFLQPYRDALAPPAPVVETVAPAPPQPPPRVPVDPVLFRSAMDAVVRDLADGMNVAANELRAAIERALVTCAGLGGTLDEMREAIAVKEKGKAKAPARSAKEPAAAG